MGGVDWLSLIRGFFDAVFSLPGLPFFRVILGFILVFLAPGFAWTLVFFRGKQINLVERVALAFGLSIALVTLSILALNVVMGVRITGLNSVLIIIFITVIPLAFYGVSQFMRQR